MSTAPEHGPSAGPYDGPYADGFFRVVKPHPLLTVSEWAELYRILPQGSSVPGPWRNDQTPYLVEIMDALSGTSRATEVVFAKGTQIGATEAGTNWIGYIIDQEPGPILAFQPTEDNAMAWSKERLGPSLEQCERTRDKMAPAKSRSSGNTILQKAFAGGGLYLAGMNSANSVSSRPVPYMYFDEVDRYPLGIRKEGDPISLALQRMSTFPRGKAFFTSTPTLKLDSRIWDMYQDSDQRVYEVPCPFCGHYQEITFDRLVWDKGDYSDVRLACCGCAVPIPELYKPKMLAAGKWVPRKPGHWRVGFHLSSLYSPLGWLSWAKIAHRYEAAEGDVGKMMAFTNTILGLPWEEDCEVIAADYLLRRVETYKAQVPMGVLALTLGVDVQGDRLECEVIGWGEGNESWGIEYRIFEGSPAILTYGDPVNNPSVWEELLQYRNREFQHEDGGTIRIRRVMIDSGGNCTDTVYRFCHNHWDQGISPVKGSGLPGRPLMNKPTKSGRGQSAVRLYVLGVNQGKDMVFGNLKVEEPGPGYCHFPDDHERGYDAHFYAGLIAERKKRVRNKKTGLEAIVWELPDKARNEPFDIRVYNLAAISSLKLDWNQLRENREINLGKAAGVATPQRATAKPKQAGMRGLMQRPNIHLPKMPRKGIRL